MALDLDAIEARLASVRAAAKGRGATDAVVEAAVHELARIAAEDVPALIEELRFLRDDERVITPEGMRVRG